MNNKNSPKVSVIISAYNQGKYLEDALNSVLNQTFTDWECIIANDGSTDNTEQIAKKYVKSDNRFKYIYQENKGLSGARNTGIRDSVGEYFQFLDADDLILPEKLQLQVDFLENNPKFDVIYSDFRWFKFFSKNKYLPSEKRLPGAILDRLILEECMPIHSFLLRKRCIEKAGLFDESLECYEDRDFWVRIAYSGFKFYSMDKILALYRVHDANMSRDTLRQAKGKVAFIKKVKNYISSGELKTDLHISKMKAEAHFDLAAALIDRGYKKEGFFKLIKSCIVLLYTNPISLPKKIIILLLCRMNAKRVAKLKKVYHYTLNFLNAIRRKVNFAIVELKYKFKIKDRTPPRLHLGCGGQHFEGYINIDRRKTRATDLVCDIRKLPYPDSSVELIETYHVIEYLPRHDLAKALQGWHRVLSPNGRLIIECPDFDKTVKEYIRGNEERLNSIFGLQRFPGDTHLFGYNFERLKKNLEKVGFDNIRKKEPQDYHSKDEPCLRVECIKK